MENPHERIAQQIIQILAYDWNSHPYITEEQAIEVLYPQVAYLKGEVRLRGPKKWILMVDKDENHNISVQGLTVHLGKIAFTDSKGFWVDLKKADEEYKAKNPFIASNQFNSSPIGMTPGGETPDGITPGGPTTPGSEDCKPEPYDAKIFHNNE